eukprot:TRINITY_DN8159_c0_g1_i1.p1 TRINITY_DN8159_c0_g1~~TRINITY_DN8159_c0_g1_i1.p1  ORF type:complete len:597 (+),score=83.01 TRINITY_DN8159_c0_g1_i1:922-2712(+)
MGITQSLRQRAYLPAEPSVDRVRKDVVMPWFGYVGGIMLVWCSLRARTLATGGTGDVLTLMGVTLGGATLFSVFILVAITRRFSRSLCESTALLVCLAVVIADVGHLFDGVPTVAWYNVLVLDMMLLCNVSDASAKAAVCVTFVWLIVRATLQAEGVGQDRCADTLTRWSAAYALAIAAALTDSVLVLLVDFAATRGFAKSMHEQKAMVEASIQLSEAAAVLLSKYETEDTKTLLEGPDGERLPAGLREALLQLVQNLALYRPYLPQSCLPGSGLDGGAEEEELEPLRAASQTFTDVEDVVSPVCETASQRTAESELSLHRVASGGMLRGPVPADARWRRVTAVAVNSKSFLRIAEDGGAAVTAFIAGEVDAFVGAVAAERGVVDLVSGDHMFGNFNASRMCTTSKLGAARVAWNMHMNMTGSGSGRTRSRRTACTCGGSVLCGDFGTADTRRFMLIGSMFNTLQSLERVAAQLDVVLVDETISADADVGSSFFTMLVERLCYAKRGPRPFNLWQLSGTRGASVDPAEWMYELERRDHNPHESWNQRLADWLSGGRPFLESELRSSDEPDCALTVLREQSRLIEATVVGGTVAFCT